MDAESVLRAENEQSSESIQEIEPRERCQIELDEEEEKVDLILLQ